MAFILFFFFLKGGVGWGQKQVAVKLLTQVSNQKFKSVHNIQNRKRKEKKKPKTKPKLQTAA